MKKKILFLSPHTDDVELGAGGTLCKYIENNYQIYWLVFSTAVESVPKGMPKNTLRLEFLNVIKKLGLNSKNFKIFDIPVRRFNEHRQSILESLINVRNSFKPDLVIGPSQYDIHQDHRVISNEMVRAFKSNCSILGYELPWNNPKFKSQYFEKIDKSLMDKKYEILKSYSSQISLNRNYFDKDFIFGLARTRGVQINSKYAEAYEVIRWIEN
tara:strand:- start:32 stop:670 length:639 start_codon:yes stop_codon:yes gene_type:complete